MDGPTDRLTYRVACTRLKTEDNFFLGISHKGTVKCTQNHTATYWFNEDGNAPMHFEGHFNLVENVDSSDIVYRAVGAGVKGRTDDFDINVLDFFSYFRTQLTKSRLVNRSYHLLSLRGCRCSRWKVRSWCRRVFW